MSQLLTFLGEEDSDRVFYDLHAIEKSYIIERWWIKVQKFANIYRKLHAHILHIRNIHLTLSNLNGTMNFHDAQLLLSDANFQSSLKVALKNIPLQPLLLSKKSPSSARNPRIISSALLITRFPSDTLNLAQNEMFLESNLEALNCFRASSLLSLRLSRLVALVIEQYPERFSYILQKRYLLAYRYTVGLFVNALEIWRQKDKVDLVNSLEKEYFEISTLVQSFSNGGPLTTNETGASLIHDEGDKSSHHEQQQLRDDDHQQVQRIEDESEKEAIQKLLDRKEELLQMICKLNGGTVAEARARYEGQQTTRPASTHTAESSSEPFTSSNLDTNIKSAESSKTDVPGTRRGQSRDDQSALNPDLATLRKHFGDQHMKLILRVASLIPSDIIHILYERLLDANYVVRLSDRCAALLTRTDPVQAITEAQQSAAFWPSSAADASVPTAPSFVEMMQSDQRSARELVATRLLAALRDRLLSALLPSPIASVEQVIQVDVK